MLFIVISEPQHPIVSFPEKRVAKDQKVHLVKMDQLEDQGKEENLESQVKEVSQAQPVKADDVDDPELVVKQVLLAFLVHLEAQVTLVQPELVSKHNNIIKNIKPFCANKWRMPLTRYLFVYALEYKV